MARSNRSLVTPIAVGAVGLVAIGVAQSVPNRHSIEEKLTNRSAAALRTAGIDGAEVSFVGRDGTVRVKSTVDADSAGRIVRAQEGVRVAVVQVVPGGQTTPPQARPPAVTLAVTTGRVVLSGTVPSTAAQTAIVEETAARFGPGTVDTRLTVDPAVTDRGLAGLAEVAGALGREATATVELRDGTITLTGTVPSQAVKDATARAAATAAGSQSAVVDRLTIAAPPPAQVQAQLSALPPITFESGSATLTAEGQTAVARAAAILAGSPEVRVRIEGHTDTNGSPAANLTLSQARAQAVLSALVASGVAADRLTAAGFGETRLKVPDTTATNQAINRRVEFVVA